MEAASIEERVEKLEALQAIGDLKSRYADLADAKYTSAYQRVGNDAWRTIARAQAECFTHDARWFGGDQFGGTLAGRDALHEWFCRSPWRFALHYYVAPAIVLHSSETAEGRWRLWQLAIPHDAAAPVLLAAITRESYRRANGEWLINRMQFEEIHTVDLSDAPAILRCVQPRSAS